MSVVSTLATESEQVSESRDAASASWRITLVLLAAICLIHLVLATLVRQQGIFVGDDDAGYVLLARAIRDGHYVALQHVGLPWEARYPPGYPLLLAAVTAVFGERLDPMLFAGIAISVVALVLLFDLVRRHWSPTFALVVCALAAVNPQLVANAGRLQSETLYTTTVMLALWLAERTVSEGKAARRNSAASIAAATFAGLVRSIGVVLLASLAATWAIQRRYRRALLAALLALGIGGGWSVWTALAPDARARRTYGNVLVEWVLGPQRAPPIATESDTAIPTPARAADAHAAAGASAPQAETHSFLWRVSYRAKRSAVRYATDFIPWTLAVPTVRGTGVDNALWLAISLACLVAGASTMWVRLPHVVGYISAYVLFLLFWPAYIARFVEPLVPFLLLWLLAGAGVIGARFVRRAPHLIVAGLALLLVPGSMVRHAEALSTAHACDRSSPLTSSGCASADVRAFITAAQFARTLPSGDSVFLAPKERPFFYYSGRRTIVMGSAVEQGADTIGAYLRHTPARLVLIGRVGFNKPYVTLREALLRSCRDFDVVREFPPSALMLRVRETPDSATESAACGAISRLPAATKGVD